MLKQTFENYEFIIIDDGSPDKSAEVVMRYALLDPRIRLIRQENAGAPAARNRGLSMAQGKYVYFMDSDDWVEPTMLEDMYNLAEAHELEVVLAGFYIDTYYDAARYVSACVFQPDQVFTDQREFRRNAYRFFDCNLLYTPWNKLTRTDYLREQGIKFINTFWDDFPFNLDLVRNVKRLGVLSNRYYHFIRARAESETARYRDNMYDKREEEHRWILDLYRQWDQNDEASMEMIYRRYIERVLGCVENMANPDCSLTLAQKLKTTREMILAPEVEKALGLSRPRSLMMKVMLLPVRMKSASLTYLEGAFIARVRRSNTRIYALLKASR